MNLRVRTSAYWKEVWTDLRPLYAASSEQARAVSVPSPSRDEEAYPAAEHLQVLYPQLVTGLAAQSAELERIERKATTVLATTGILAGLALTAGSQLTVGLLGGLCFAAALITFLIGIACGVIILWPEASKGVVDAQRLMEIAYSPPTNRLLAVLSASAGKSFQLNRESGVAPRRTRWLKRQLRMLLASLGFITLAFIASSIPALSGATRKPTGIPSPTIRLAPSTTATGTGGHG
jgi:hypothetical protein